MTSTDDGVAKGSLQIGSMESTVIGYLSEFLVQFHQKNPNVSVKVETGTSEVLVEKVLDHKLVGAFVAGPIKHTELFTKQVRKEKLCLITANDTSINSDIKEHLKKPLLVFPQGCSYRQALEYWMKEEGIVAEKVYEFNTLNAIFASVISGLGVTLFPESCIKQYSQHDSLNIIEIPIKYATISTIFVYRKDGYLSGAMCSFINALN